MKTYFINTLGCKVNQFESDALARELEAAGYVPAPTQERADLCIVNTCTVTQKASMQSRQAIRNLIRRHPDARIIATGCSAQTAPDEIRRIEGVHTVVPNTRKEEIVKTLPPQKDPMEPPGIPKRPTDPGEVRQPGEDSSQSTRRTRPFLKIQDGCEAFCSYCIVPYARGKSRSMPPVDVLAHLDRLAVSGYREVVLTGIHLGCYGPDLAPPTTLGDLLGQIETGSRMERIRLSSIEPGELSEEIIRLVSDSKRLCRHFHIPLQSGDDEVLKRMNRPYTGALFRGLVRRIHGIMPDAAIGADILVGFPGETDAAFASTHALVEALPLTYLHVFPFSPREGTPAAKFKDKVADATIKKRAKTMRELSAKKRAEFFKGRAGGKSTVLIETKRDRSSGLLKGLTSNYIPVLVEGDDTLMNTLVRVKLKSEPPYTKMTGKIIS